MVARVLIGLTVAVLITGLYFILRPFFPSMAWAAILVLTFWPFHRRLLAKMAHFPQTAAFISTALLALVVILVIFPLTLTIVTQSIQFFESIDEWLSANAQTIQSKLSLIPFAGPQLAEQAATVLHEGTEKVLQLALDYKSQLASVVAAAAKGVARFLFEALSCFLFVFFLFRDGSSLGRQIIRAAARLAGPSGEKTVELMRQTVRGVFFGMFVTAIVQGVLATIGYVVAGAPLAFFLGFVSFVFSLIPFGTPFVYLPAALYLIYQNNWFWGVLLAVWGIFVVSTADNVLRPIFISQATALPFIAVFIGALGGAIAFGMLGVFIGPVLFALSRALWREWLLEAPEHGSASSI